jgi:hypothetical protein
MKGFGIGAVIALLAMAWSSAMPIPEATAQGIDRCTAAARYPVNAAEARAGRTETVVPVIIHMMMSDVPPRTPRWPSDPRSLWDPGKVTEFFSRDGRINRIWSQANIRVAVVRVDECPYSPVALRPDREADVDVATPEEVGWEHFFDDINRRYNARDREALNLYIWIKVGIRQFTSAYGTSPRRPTSAVWVDAFCVLGDDRTTPEDEQKMRPETCARKLAHEIGHALTLRHLCKMPSVARTHPDADLPSCTQFGNSRNLMHPRPENGQDFEYTRLDAEQTRDATPAARAYPQQ